MKITAAESLVMDVLWAHAPLEADDVTTRLTEQGWTRTTVRTLLSRLVQKGAVEHRKTPGQRDLFSPLIARAEYAHAESRNLVDRLFGGKVSPLFAQFAERAELSDEDIAELKAMIERIEDGR
ncbi:BlaI/MecI/CopY family transcriptional regulator [soil metagenome]